MVSVVSIMLVYSNEAAGELEQCMANSNELCTTNLCAMTCSEEVRALAIREEPRTLVGDGSKHDGGWPTVCEATSLALTHARWTSDEQWETDADKIMDMD